MASAAPSPDPSLDAEWEEWKKKFGKTYSPDEEGHRRAVWEDSKKTIEAHNADYKQGKTSFSMGLNQFSDLTTEEFRRNCCGSLMCRGKTTHDLPIPEDLGKNSSLTPGRDQVWQSNIPNLNCSQEAKKELKFSLALAAKQYAVHCLTKCSALWNVGRVFIILRLTTFSPWLMYCSLALNMVNMKAKCSRVGVVWQSHCTAAVLINAMCAFIPARVRVVAWL